MKSNKRVKQMMRDILGFDFIVNYKISQESLLSDGDDCGFYEWAVDCGLAGTVSLTANQLKGKNE